VHEKSLYDDVSSPTVTSTSVMIIAVFAAKEIYLVVTADIRGAYLNAEMKSSVIHMKLDPILSGMLVQLDPNYSNYLLTDGALVLELRKALNGCVESAKLWNEHISKTLISLGFAPNPQDRCVFNLTARGVQCTVCVYVDDLLVTCCDQELMEDTLSKLIARYNEVKVARGLVHSYLGMTFDFSIPDGVITLHPEISCHASFRLSIPGTIVPTTTAS